MERPKLTLHQSRATIVVLYILGVLVTGITIIIIGQTLENAFLVEVGAWEIIFGILLAKPIIRLLQRRRLQEYLCDGCDQWFPLYGRWRCNCQAVTVRHAFARCPREDCLIGFDSINCPHCQLTHNL